MRFALFDILTGDYKKIEFDSIKAHLYRLLNARTGSLQHLPDYGLPDITELYQELPYSVQFMCDAIIKTIKKYEPRLQNVVVTRREHSDRQCVVQLEIRATTINQEPIEMSTYFDSSGAAEIASAEEL
jgi:type VI secretion system protein